ncbi:MAG: TolC family protein [Gemmataceae bacterium]
MPTDTPITTPLTPDRCAALKAARELRPEVRQIHKEIQVVQLLLLRAQNYLLPDLRFFSRYGVNGLDANLGDALSKMASKPFSNWETGLQLEIPIGMRAANAEVTRAKLVLGQRIAFLRDQEGKLFSTLQRSYRELIQYREEILTRRSQREAVGVQLKAAVRAVQGRQGEHRPAGTNAAQLGRRPARRIRRRVQVQHRPGRLRAAKGHHPGVPQRDGGGGRSADGGEGEGESSHG